MQSKAKIKQNKSSLSFVDKNKKKYAKKIDLKRDNKENGTRK